MGRIIPYIMENKKYLKLPASKCYGVLWHFMFHKLTAMWVKQCHVYHPPVITINICGIYVYHSQSWVVYLWHCFTHMILLCCIKPGLNYPVPRFVARLWSNPWIPGKLSYFTNLNLAAMGKISLYLNCLVVFRHTSENMSSSVGISIPIYEMEDKTCSKPPTSSRFCKINIWYI